jgi:hypothetical protein
MTPCDCFQDERPGFVIAFHAPRDSVQQARNSLLLHADQINSGSLVAKRATADLLSRCVHLRNSILRDDPKLGDRHENLFVLVCSQNSRAAAPKKVSDG